LCEREVVSLQRLQSNYDIRLIYRDCCLLIGLNNAGGKWSVR